MSPLLLPAATRGPDKLHSPVPRLAIWFSLALLHFLAGLVAWKGGSEFLGPLVAASVYLPLWPLGKLGLPVTHGSGWFFPPPTLLGWGIVLIFWATVYWLVACGLGKLSRKWSASAAQR